MDNSARCSSTRSCGCRRLPVLRGSPGRTPTGGISTAACSPTATPRGCRWSSWRLSGPTPPNFRLITCWSGWWSCPTPNRSASVARISAPLASSQRLRGSGGARPIPSSTPTPGGHWSRSRPASLRSAAELRSRAERVCRGGGGGQGRLQAWTHRTAATPGGAARTAFALAYFGVVGDRQRGDLVGSLEDAAGYAALVTALSALNVLLSPLQRRLRRRVHENEQQR